MEGFLKRANIWSGFGGGLLIALAIASAQGQFTGTSALLLAIGVAIYGACLYVLVKTDRYRKDFSQWPLLAKLLAIILVVPGFVFTVLSLVVWQEFKNASSS